MHASLTFPRAVWQLFSAQLRYAWRPILSVLLVFTVAGGVFSWLLDEQRMLGKVWGILFLLGGMILNFHLWATDMRERRSLGWLHLPISPAALATARVALPFAIQTLIALPFLLLLPFWLPAGGVGAAAMGKIVGMHAFTLAIVVSVYCSEELMVRAFRWGVKGVLFANVGGGVALLLVIIYAEELGLPPIDSLAGAAVCYALAVAMAAVMVWLFDRRASYLLGLDACSSMPVDWSHAAQRSKNG